MLAGRLNVWLVVSLAWLPLAVPDTTGKAIYTFVLNPTAEQ